MIFAEAAVATSERGSLAELRYFEITQIKPIMLAMNTNEKRRR